MATFTLSTLARYMAEMDICMMVSQSARGSFNSRPMSNNGDVKYDGVSYSFTYEASQKIKDLEANPQVILNFEGKEDLFVAVGGKATLIRSKTKFAEHWVDSLNQWFKEGIDTPGIVLIKVKGSRLHYWQREKEGKIKL